MIKLILLLPFLMISSNSGGDAYRKLPCETPALAPSCLHIHGRLNQGNGTPSTRLWHIGTHHEFGIYSNQYGLLHDDTTLDNEDPTLPASVERQRTKDRFLGYVYADFEVCPLEPYKEDHMQAACIQSATHIVVSQ